jgi:hypothetical protein
MAAVASIRRQRTHHSGIIKVPDQKADDTFGIKTLGLQREHLAQADSHIEMTSRSCSVPLLSASSSPACLLLPSVRRRVPIGFTRSNTTAIA